MAGLAGGIPASPHCKEEEVIYNQFSRGIWVSSSRESVDAKFEFAMREMKQLIDDGHVQIVEKNGKQYFEAITGSGRKRLAQSDQYSIENAIKTGNYKAISAWDQRALAEWTFPKPAAKETKNSLLFGSLERAKADVRVAA